MMRGSKRVHPGMIDASQMVEMVEERHGNTLYNWNIWTMVRQHGIEPTRRHGDNVKTITPDEAARFLDEYTPKRVREAQAADSISPEWLETIERAKAASMAHALAIITYRRPGESVKQCSMRLRGFNGK